VRIKRYISDIKKSKKGRHVIMNSLKMFRIRQKLHSAAVKDIPLEVSMQLRGLNIKYSIKKGDTVAITVGSRGIRNIDQIVKAIVDILRELGARPFIIPAMGSHGGATAEGQRDVLEHYGVTEELMGAPIKATMDVVEIGRTPDGIKVNIDKFAYEADHIIVVNRIKVHTDFKGEIESGLMKMMAIGLGKHKGAHLYHQAAIEHGMERIITDVGRVVLKNGHVLCGIGIIEDGFGETAEIRAFRPEELENGEKAMLIKSKEYFPKLPFDNIDILINDVMGKNISGTGMDTNIIGRFYVPLYSKEPDKPRIKRVLVSDLTHQSDGNAIGIGFADFCNQRIVDKMDKYSTYINALTGMCPEKARIPMSFSTDKEMLETALRTIGFVKPEEARVIHIYSTLHMEYMEISQPLAGEISKRGNVEILEGPRSILFDENGNFVPVIKTGHSKS
jgi:hypothetical protein